MKFEWDEAKAERNQAKHGVNFEVARLVFLDSARVDFIDSRIEYGETRHVTVGLIGDVLHVVAYSRPKPNTIRIISARRANRKEIRRHGNR